MIYLYESLIRKYFLTVIDFYTFFIWKRFSSQNWILPICIWLLVGFSHQNSDYVYTLYLTWCPKCSERSIWILDIFFSVVTVHTEKHRSNSSLGRNLRQCFHWYSLNDVYTFFIWNGRMIDILIKWSPWFILPNAFMQPK